MSNEDMASGLSSFKQYLVYGLIFLFPIAGVAVSHWFSGIFSLLMLISFWDLFRREKGVPLYIEEKVWLWLCVAFFLSFLLSAFVNGWSDIQNRYLGVDIRFLAIVPIYLMLRRYQDAWHYLLAGMALSALFLAGHAYYEIVQLGRVRAQGVYSPNLFGPMAALAAVWLLASWKHLGFVRWAIPILVAAALWAMAMSGSRGAYVGMIVMGVVWALMSFCGWRRMLAVSLVLAVPFVSYLSIPSVKSRVDVAVNEATIYFQKLESGEQESNGSINLRFEMWRAGWMVFKDAPVVGIGRGNYSDVVSEYVGEEDLQAAVASSGHAHNAYIDVLMSRGLVGFLIFLGVLFYPLYYFIKTRHLSPESALFGILHIVGFAMFSITDASTFIKGNFVSIFLLCLTLFLSWHVASVKRQVD